MGKFKKYFGIFLGVFIIFQVTIHVLKATKTIEGLTKLDLISQVFFYPSNIVDVSELFGSSYDSLHYQVKYIIVHHDSIMSRGENMILDINKYHKYDKGFGTIAYHYYIDANGKIWKLHEHSQKLNHTGNNKLNHSTIAVCLSGNFEKQTLKKKQNSSLVKLLSYLTDTYNCEIRGHREVNKYTNCPGTHIDLKKLREEVKENNLYAIIANLIYQIEL
jgi:N-acetylmuramoyl-L-alanine amidase